MLKKPLFRLAVTTFFTMSAATLAHAGGITGTVLETMNSSGYTYILVDSGTAKQWIAIPETQVTTGESVTYLEGMEMQNFHSKSLDRTFPSVIFSEGLEGKSGKVQMQEPPTAPAAPADDSFAAAVAKEKQATPMPAGQSSAMPEISGGSAGAVVPFADLKIEKAEGSNSFTVGEIFSKAKELNGKEVKIRGQVVKFSPNIMGRHWIHLQDGTGDPMQNTHDLVVTSAETAETGEVIVVSGILAAEKDFGAGYKYDAIVEKGVIER